MCFADAKRHAPRRVNAERSDRHSHVERGNEAKKEPARNEQALCIFWVTTADLPVGVGVHVAVPTIIRRLARVAHVGGMATAGFVHHVVGAG